MEMMVRRMEAAAAGEAGDTRMFLYSGHDSSLMPLLAALGKHVEDWPPYLSNLTLELWQQPSGQHFVKARLAACSVCGGGLCVWLWGTKGGTCGRGGELQAGGASGQL